LVRSTSAAATGAQVLTAMERMMPLSSTTTVAEGDALVFLENAERAAHLVVVSARTGCVISSEGLAIGEPCLEERIGATPITATPPSRKSLASD
jgi:hypothetical protein